MHIVRLLLGALVLAQFACVSKPVSDPADSSSSAEASKVSPSSQSPQTSQPSSTVYSFTKNPRQLTFLGSRSGEGYFSADGKKMIFQSERHEGNPFYQIYVMDLESGKTELVSTGKGQTTCGWIHPSGEKVLFASTHLDPDFKKKVKNELEERKTPGQKYSWSFDDQYELFERDLKSGALRRLSNAKGYDAEGAYSPDGSKIVFASNRAAYSGAMTPEEKKIFSRDNSYMMDIYIMNADGSNVQQLTTERGYDGGPFFSADGKKITWRRFAADGKIAEVYTMNIDGSEQKRVTHLNAMSWAPFFHPSGEYIIFTTNIHGYSNFELYIVDAKGEQRPVRVTHEDGFDGLPVFSPDGKKLAWTKRNSKNESQIILADWDDALARKALGLNSAGKTLMGLSPAVDSYDVRKIVNYLASAEMNGRMTGSEQEKIYTEKMAALLKEWGLGVAPGVDGFLSQFEFTSGVELTDKNNLQVDGQSLRLKQDWVPVSYSASGSIEPKAIVFAGYGIAAPATDKFSAYDSYKGLDVKDKWVMVFKDVPQDVEGDLRFHLNFYSRAQHKVTVARNHGAIGIIFVAGPRSHYKNKLPEFTFEGAHSDSSLFVINVADEVATAWLKESGKSLHELQKNLDGGAHQDGFEIAQKKLSAQVEIKNIKAQGTNVIGMIKVPNAKDTIFIGGHADHLGHGLSGSSLATADMKDHIHYGADDNASGVALVLELAHHFANHDRSKLKSNLVFALWSGEELGNLGSKNYVKKWQETKGTTPIKAYLNFDMVGRLQDHLFVQGLGSSKAWSDFLEPHFVESKLAIVAQEDPYLPTDQMSFYVDAKAPSISFFTGAHKEYHTPLDKPELLNYQGIEQIAKMALGVVNGLATTNVSIPYQQVAGNPNKNMQGRKFRVYLGTIPDYSQEGVKGVRISGASPKSPAEAAGLKPKDVIIELAGQKIENLYDYTYLLQSVRPGVEIPLKVMRNSQLVELKITPQAKE